MCVCAFGLRITQRFEYQKLHETEAPPDTGWTDDEHLLQKPTGPLIDHKQDL